MTERSAGDEGMTEETTAVPEPLTMLTAQQAADRLSDGTAPRDFLGLDPVVQNPALLTRSLTELGAVVFGNADGLLGAVVNPANPRQLMVSTTGGTPRLLAAGLELLRANWRCTSVLVMAVDGDPGTGALAPLGFRVTGRMRQHVHRGGAYLDVLVHYLEVEP